MITIKGVNPRMIANNLTSFSLVHPGELIKEELECREISQRAFALKFDVSYPMLNEILNGKRPVSTDFALLIEAALGVNAGLLVRMQTNYDLQVAQKNKKLRSRLAKIREIAAVL
ncbi:MAG: HigA family addiction module antidote protein [Prevotellaceae bacterium]|jgi:addiction module HigA family antidote|nr:HigA family addiction module antidote protein [Prevotellaceae bacterium]